MAWTDAVIDRLALQPCCGYLPKGSVATEPTALAALALAAYGRHVEAEVSLAALAKAQAVDGSLGVNAAEPAPCWPTSLAVLAWSRKLPAPGDGPSFGPNARRAVDWLLLSAGCAAPRTIEMGHDSTLVGWAWVEGTHSWIEPTALAVLALRSAGYHNHARTREAVRLLLDRLLDSGGANYGNTTVLGQTLRPHVLPTALTILALAGLADARGRLEPSIAYLESALSGATATVSLGYGLMALAACGRSPAAADTWLEARARTALRRDDSGWKLAILALAGRGSECPLIPSIEEGINV